MTHALFPTAILAGGLATRLHPLTQTTPKALVDVAGQPFIFRQLELLRNNGVTDVVVCVGHLGELVADRLQDWRDRAISVQVSFDGAELLGTAGALRQALPLLGEAFFVMYGDSYLTCDFRSVQRAFERSGKPALMTVFENEGRWERSNVEFADRQLRGYDKRQQSPAMRHVDYGLGVLSRTVLGDLAAGQPHDLALLYQRLLAQDQLAGFEVPERFYEIGSFQGLTQTRAHVASRATKVGRGA